MGEKRKHKPSRKELFERIRSELEVDLRLYLDSGLSEYDFEDDVSDAVYEWCYGVLWEVEDDDWF